MKTIKGTLLLAVAALASLCAASAQTVKDYNINIGDFNELVVKGAVNVDHRISADSAGVVSFSCPDAMASWTEFSCKKGKLTVTLTVPEDARAEGLPTITVRSRSLLKVTNEADSAVRLLDTVSVPSFEANLVGNGAISVRHLDATDVAARLKTGGGRIALGGTCRKAAFTLTGTGQIQADALEAESASCTCTGTGTIGVNASKKLKVSGAGTTSIYYLGSPEITKSMAIGLKLYKAE
jgi:hypothetical protein